MSERGSVLSCVFTTLVVVEITHTLVSGFSCIYTFCLVANSRQEQDAGETPGQGRELRMRDEVEGGGGENVSEG